jgi:serine/threonine protein kinase
MKKIIWQNLLSRAIASPDTLHLHTNLLATFLARDVIHMCSNQGDIGFDEFEQFAKDRDVSKADLFNGPLKKIFRTLDEELSKRTLAFIVDDHSIIYHFKDDLCTDIYNVEIDLDSYTVVETLGSGTNGTARLYKNKDGREIVLKTPNPEIPNSGYYIARKRDIDIAQFLYSNDGFYCINEHTRSALNNGRSTPAYGFYAITPYIPGANLAQFCQKIQSEAELIETLLALTQELHRIHEAGVIHGDIHSSNIRLWRDPKTNKVGVRFIDFESAYYRDTENATTTHQKISHWAPERRKATDPSAALIPHPAQDMFSLGYTLWKALYHHPLLKQLSFIAQFYYDCVRPEKERPLAERFINELKREAALNKTSVISNTASFFIAGKEHLIRERHFTVNDEQKTQEEPLVELASQNYSILKKTKTTPFFKTPEKAQSYQIIPTLVDFGVRASGIIWNMGGYSKQ